MIALVFLLLIILMAVFASLVAPHDPDALGTPFETPSLDHPLGTDHNGRDTFSRIVYGGQVSLRSGFQIVGLAALIAVPLGLLAGFRGGGTDVTLMRIMDGLSSFPPLVLALAVAGVLGADLENAILAISLVMIPGFARLTRAQTLAVREETFIEASHSMGTRAGPDPAQARPAQRRVAAHRRGVARHRVRADRRGPAEPARLRRATAEVELGRDDPGRPPVPQRAPVAGVRPGLALVFTVLAFNTLGDGIRDALGLGMPKGKQRIKGRLGLTTVTRPADQAAAAGVRPAARGHRPVGRVPHRRRGRRPSSTT